ncbi:hypothetical protein AAG570_008308 [Ranatra chinensis]|uniref:glutathione synthase n=1 Tax=Ranatra chinensis TaxID=642074 RepID=A0ABD0XST2_9HEMI
MEFEVRKLAPTATVIRRNLQELSQQATLLPDRTLLVGDYVVAVVYYRSGYDPSQYTTDDCWKVQQVLATPGVVEKFLSEPSDVAAVRGMFTEIYSLDLTPEGDKAVELVMKEPEGFVLKPQREGGGNNIYGHDIPKVLQEQKELRKSWILMRRIRPPVQPNYIIRPSSDSPPQLTNVVSELGVFGVIIGDSENIIVNRSVGHMLRTKQSDVNEGGVAAGLGSLDSPYLI